MYSKHSSELTQPVILSCEDRQHLNDIIPCIHEALMKNAYCILKLWDASEIALLEITNRLGNTQLHVRSGADGVATISPDVNPVRDGLDFSKYLGATSTVHLPHTDGAYLDGFTLHNGNLIRIGPPAIVLLQCVQPAEVGGVNVIIDGQKILWDMMRNHPEILSPLLIPGNVSFCRDDHLAMHVSIFEQVSINRFRIRMRSDEALFVKTNAVTAVRQFIEKYIANPVYQQHIQLQAGEILILDNFRSLHGRDSFSSSNNGQKRLFRRTWIFDQDASSSLVNFAGVYQSCRAFMRFEPYTQLEHPQSLTNPLPTLGIRLPVGLCRKFSHATHDSWLEAI